MERLSYDAQNAVKACEEHEHKELTSYCKTCKKFICTTCAKTSHGDGHDWDFIPSVAKERRAQTPVKCGEIKEVKLPKYREKLRVVNNNISAEEEKRKEDLQRLEERRVAIIEVVNGIIDAKKRNRNEISKNVTAGMSRQGKKLDKMIQFLEKMSTSLYSNIRAYSDFDVIEMERDMMRALEEVEEFHVDIGTSPVVFMPGVIDAELIGKMVGNTTEASMAYGDNSVIVNEIETFSTQFDSMIRSIAPVTHTHAWIGDNKHVGIKCLSLEDIETRSRSLPQWYDFVMLNNGNLVLTDYDNKLIRQITTNGKATVTMKTKPFCPTYISKTLSDDILVTLRDDGDPFVLQPSSHRMVQRITQRGKVLQTYEFQEDGMTRLFTLPTKKAENRNSDICVVNRVSERAGELVVIQGYGLMQFTYHGQEGGTFNPSDVACDSDGQIIVADYMNKSLHLLGPDGRFLRYLLSDIPDFPQTLALHRGMLWVGCYNGTVIAYTYEEE